MPLIRRALIGSLALALPLAAAGGTLTGKTVYVSGGHGWGWNGVAWTTLAAPANSIIEDLWTAEFVDQFLVDELRRMGARVVPLREADMNPERVVVDDGAAIAEGTVAEESTGDVGFGGPLPLDAESNPFQAGTARLIRASPTETGRMVLPLAVPTRGRYTVYVSYVAGADRASDAHYLVRHAGGESSFRIDQRRHGSTWVPLGSFWFEGGAPPARASVALANDSAGADALLSLDAVRAGGGPAAVLRGGETEGRPLWESSAASFAQFMGAPSTVYASDVLARPRFAAWDHLPDEDAVYLSIHTAAAGTFVRGTTSYAYGPDAPPAPLASFTGTTGSLELSAAVHDELVSDLQASWEPGWTDRGRYCGYFGELRPAENDEMPSMLLELANVENASDSAALLSPRFLRVTARATAQGVAKYFSARDGTALTLPPEAPVALRLLNDGSGGMVATWLPPPSDPSGGDAPTAYRVYVSRDGNAFDDGEIISGTSTTLVAGVGEARYVRVAAVNAGGESPPTELVGARRPALAQPTVLVVGGFDRMDGGLALAETIGTVSVRRVLQDRMNDGAYAARHGAALAAAGFSFDGATDESVEAGNLELAPYPAVDWFVGQESTLDLPFSAAARAVIDGYAAAGGRLFVSGSEIGWALDSQGDAETRAFLQGTLHASLANDDAGTYGLVAAGGAFTGLPPLDFEASEAGSYDAAFPDAWIAEGGASPLLEYQGGAGGVAALSWQAGLARGVLFGFPFETLRGDGVRAEVMRRVMAELGVVEPLPPEPPPGTPAGDHATSGCGCGEGATPAPLAWAVLPVLWARRREPAMGPRGA